MNYFRNSREYLIKWKKNVDEYKLDGNMKYPGHIYYHVIVTRQILTHIVC